MTNYFKYQPFLFPETNEKSEIKDGEDDFLSNNYSVNAHSLPQTDFINLIPFNKYFLFLVGQKQIQTLFKKKKIIKIEI